MNDLEVIAPSPYREDAWEVREKNTGKVVRCGLTYDKARSTVESHKPIQKSGTPDGIYTVAIDFHGTLCDGFIDGDHDKPGPPLAGAKEAMQAFKDAGYRTTINSVWGDREKIREWLDANDIPCDHVNETPNGNDTDTSGKIDADVYVDDRGLHFNGDWDEAKRQVDSRAKKELDKIHKRFTRKSWANNIAEAYRNGALIELETAADHAEQNGIASEGQLGNLPSVFDGKVEDGDAYKGALAEVQRILCDRWRNWGGELRAKDSTCHDAGPSIGKSEPEPVKVLPRDVKVGDRIKRGSFGPSSVFRTVVNIERARGGYNFTFEDGSFASVGTEKWVRE